MRFCWLRILTLMAVILRTGFRVRGCAGRAAAVLRRVAGALWERLRLAGRAMLLLIVGARGHAHVLVCPPL